MSKVINNILGPINVKSYTNNKCSYKQVLVPINVKSYNQCIRYNKCQKLQTMH